jgi:hypothetical protein
MYPCYAPPLRVAVVALVVVIVVREHVALGHLGGVELAAAKDARRRVHHGRAGGVEAILCGVHYGEQSRGYLAVACVYFVRIFRTSRSQLPPLELRGAVLFCGMLTKCGRRR